MRLLRFSCCFCTSRASLTYAVRLSSHTPRASVARCLCHGAPSLRWLSDLIGAPGAAAEAAAGSPKPSRCAGAFVFFRSCCQERGAARVSCFVHFRVVFCWCGYLFGLPCFVRPVGFLCPLAPAAAEAAPDLPAGTVRPHSSGRHGAPVIYAGAAARNAEPEPLPLPLFLRRISEAVRICSRLFPRW